MESLAEGIRQLYLDEEYADLELRCGDQSYKLHKAVICNRSDFFKAACKKDTFKVSTRSLY